MTGDRGRRAKRSVKKREVTDLKGALESWMKTLGLEDRLKHLELVPVWEEIVGPEIAKATQIRSLDKHVLRVWVSSPPLCSELSSFRKAEILADWQSRSDTPRIVDIKFFLK